MSTDPQLAIVVPVCNEEDNIGPLVREIVAALRGRIAFEIVYVDDASRDATLARLHALQASTPELRVIRHRANAGQSTAVRNGVKAARAPWIATLDGDGQNDPADIPKLLDQRDAAASNVKLFAGWRVQRKDSGSKRWASKFANGLRQSILHDDTRDSGCGLKAIRTDLFRSLPFFDGWHRYMPALALREGFGVVHLDVTDRSRRHGKSNYGILDRGLRGVLDLFGVWWLRRRRKVVPTVTEIKP